MPPSPGDSLRLAASFYEAQRLDEAAAMCDRLLDVPSPHGDVFHLAGLVAFERGEHARSITLLRKALAAGIQSAPLHANLSICLATTGEMTQSLRHANYAAQLAPGSSQAAAALADASFAVGAVGEAITYLRAALRLEPNPHLHSNFLYYLNFLPGYRPAEIADEHRTFGRLYADPVKKLGAYKNDKNPERKLRIGYLSADMYSHSVAHFLAPLLEGHDRSAVEIIAFPANKRADSVTERLRSLADAWKPVLGLSDFDVARVIRDAGVDVLVELGGHTGNSRMLALAYGPAPVQISWCGYPNTVGVSAIGYRFTDALVDPPGDADKYHVETLVRLSQGFLCYEPPPGAPEVAPPPCLEGKPFTFGSFNTLPKITPKVIELWARILRKVDGSRMFLKAGPFADEGVRGRVIEEFGKHGVEASRLLFEARTPGQLGHLARYADIDVALDPFPYNGTTTTCEALYMGVPVIALQGDRHASRVSASLLTRIGLESLVGATPKQYQSIAVGLASNRKQLAEIRSGLRARLASSPLFDKQGFARSVEAAYRSLWKAYCESAEKEAR